jgi:hypothetical protein
MVLLPPTEEQLSYLSKHNLSKKFQKAKELFEINIYHPSSLVPTLPSGNGYLQKVGHGINLFLYPPLSNFSIFSDIIFEK